MTGKRTKNKTAESPQAGNSETTSSSSASSASFKNFRHHPDMENFYRFIYDNDLRFEALDLIDQVLSDKRKRKRLKAERAKSH